MAVSQFGSDSLKRLVQAIRRIMGISAEAQREIVAGIVECLNTDLVAKVTEALRKWDFDVTFCSVGDGGIRIAPGSATDPIFTIKGYDLAEALEQLLHRDEGEVPTELRDEIVNYLSGQTAIGDLQELLKTT